MKIRKKLLSIMLSISMIITMFPYSVFAAGNGVEEAAPAVGAAQEAEKAAPDAANAEDEPAAAPAAEKPTPAEAGSAAASATEKSSGADNPAAASATEKSSGADNPAAASATEKPSPAAKEIPAAGETPAAGEKAMPADAKAAEKTDTVLSVEFDEKADDQFKDGRMMVRVSAKNSDADHGASTARLYFWDYDKDFFDKDKRDDVRVMNEQVTAAGLSDDGKIILDNETPDAKSVDAQLVKEKDAKYIEFDVPADTAYKFDLPLVLEDETAEKAHIIVEPVVVDQDEDSEAVSEPLELDWEDAENPDAETAGDVENPDAEPEDDAETAEDGDLFTLDKNAMKDTDETWAEAQGKFSLKASRGAKGPVRAAGVNGYADYEPYMTVHTLKQDGRNITNGSTIDPESNFQLQLQFKLDFEDMITNGTKYSYRLPANVSVGDVGSPTQQVTLYNSRRVAIGTYYIQNDVMFVTFPGYYDEVVANFSMSASWTGTEGKSEIQVPWNGRTETYLINNCQLKIIKNSTGYKTDEEGNLYNHYKVTIKPEEDNLSVGGVTLKDTMSQTRMKLYEDYFGAGNDVLVTIYDGNNRVVETQYFEADGNKIKTSPVSLDIGTFTISAGGKIIVEYAGKIDKADRLQMDATNSGDSYTNTAVASQDWRNPTMGQIEHPSVEARIKGDYKNESSWVFKEAGDDTKTKNQGGDTVTVVPYTVTINKYRRYSLGGGAVTDAITEFDDGDVRKDVRYDTSGGNGVAPYVIATDKNGDRTINQTWVILDADTWAELKEIVKSTGSLDVTQLDKLNQNPTLVGKLLTAAGKTGNELTTELAETLIFTSEDAHNFVWFMPKDSTPTTYTIYYFTLVGSEADSFKNSASLWYTLYEGVPGGSGQGWVRPVKRVLNATKTNEGVYIGADGNFYVDYTITVGLEPGSAGFEDIFLKDALPSHTINGIKAYDWITGMEEDDLPLYAETDVTRTGRKRALNSAISISSDSTDPRVQEVVNRSLAFIGRARENPNSTSTFRNERIVSYTTNDTSFADINSAAQGAIYKTSDSRPAGQFFADGNARNGTNVPIDKGDTFSLTWMIFWLGDLPGTEEGYDITFKYTMQVNPYLVENLAGHLEEIGQDYVKLSNTATVGTSIVSNNGRTKRLEFSGINPRNAGYIGEATTSYWIGATRPTDYVTKDVKSYDKDSRLLLYDVTINEEGQLDATDKKYVIEDQLNISGLKYKANSLTLKDADGKVIWTNVAGKSVDAAYSSMDSSFNVTDNDNKVNSFALILDNKDGHLTDSNGKLKKMYMEYGVDFTDSDSDVTLMNTVSLRLRSGVSDTDSSYDTLIDEDTSEYAVDKAVDKHISRDPDKRPSAANHYTASYYILVDPTSTNAYELGNIRAGESFTVKDTLSDSLLLNIDGVKVEQTLNGRTTDITDSCGLAYDVNDNVFEATIPVTDPTATYRIDYEAFVQAEAMTLVRLKNTAEISGTHVKPDTIQEKVRIYEYDESASAVTYGIRLKKFDAKDIETKLSASFDLYEYNTTSKAWDLLTTGVGDAKRITTDDEGFVKISNTLSGNFRYIKANTWYKLVEAVAPDDYMLDDTPTYYYVSTNGEVTGSVPKDNNADIERYSVLVMPEQGADEEEFPLVYVSDSKLEFRVLKTDKATREPLEGAEFTLYTDPECTQILDKQTTDSDGRVQFENLEVPTTVTLYLKETVTPENYISNEDKIYTLNFVDGILSGDVTDQDGNKMTHTKEGFESLLTVTNTSKTGRLEVQKSVTTDVTANRTKDTFAFVLKLTDAQGTELTDPVKLTTVTADGEETEGTYRSGAILEMKHGEKAILPELPDGTLYEVTEVADNMYSTTVQVVDTVTRNGDNKSAAAGYEAQGTIQFGEADTVKYVNTLLDTLIVKKQVVAENGDELNIPDGHTLMIKSKETSTDAYLTAVWNEAAGEYELKRRSSASIGFYTTTADGEPIEGGFRVTGLPRQTDNTYYIEESHATITGYTYVLTDAKDTNPNVVSVDVRSKDEASKTLINTYIVKEDSVEAEVRAQKVLEGHDLTKDQFSFVLYQKMGMTGYSKIVQSTTNSQSGRIVFDTLSFDRAGTYYYQIKEVKPSNADENITYQETPIFVKIVVLTVDGKLIAEDPVYSPIEDGTSIEPVFTNTYINKEVTASLEAQKKMSGKSADEDAFTLRVREVESDYQTAVTDESGDPVEYTKTTPAIEKDGTVSVSFDEMTFTSAGDHYYVISEDLPDGDSGSAASNIIYDETVYRAKVSVTETSGGLRATVTYMDKDGNALESGEKPQFVNSYDASGNITLQGSKTIVGRDFKTGDKWKFNVSAVTQGAPLPANTSVTIEPTEADGATKAFSFGQINFSLSDLDGESSKTFRYEVTEDASVTVGHVTNDTAKKIFEVTVTDDGSGTLSVETTEASQTIEFTNTYKAEGKVKFEGTKTLTGRSLTRDDVFTFTITEDGETVGTGTSDQTGKITFSEITYSIEGEEKSDLGEHTYTVSEDTPTDSSISCKTQPYTVTVNVTDNKDGTLTATPSENYNKLDFVNEYGASGSIEVKGTKSITGRKYKTGDKWVFNIEALDSDAPALETTRVEVQPTEADDQSVEFSLGTFRYQLSDLKGQSSRTFSYRITEDPNVKVAGVTNDTALKTLKITVSDAGNGNLSVAVAEDSDPVTFTNNYRATGSIVFAGKKSIDSRALNVSDGHDVFEFTITGPDGYEQTVRNDSTGKIEYLPIEFVLDEDHLNVIGDYTYTVVEETTTQGGVTKDSREYTVVVNVADNGDGTLAVTAKSVTAENAPAGTVAPTKDTLDFVNTYEATGDFTFAGTKSIDVRELAEGEKYSFTIQETGLLGAAKGDPITAESDDTGKINYPKLAFVLNKDTDDTGTHTYKVTENVVDANGITSSTVTYTVKLEVTDLENGKLKVEPAAGSDDPKKLDFENAYKATGNITFSGKKSIDCRALNVDGDHDVFEFTITGPDGYEQTVRSNADGNIEYPTLEYILDKAHPDTLGDYTYTVVEETTTQDGITKDSREYTVVVNVADNGDGTLAVTAKSVKASGADSTQPSDGSSSDDAQPSDGSGSGDAQPSDGSGNGDAQPADGSSSDDAQPADGSSSDDAQPADGSSSDDAQPADGSGSETALTEKDLDFVNEYKATGEYTFEGTKSIDTRELTTGENYSFAIQETNEQGESIGEPLKAVSDDTGRIDYPTIVFELNKDRDDIGTHTYEVTEEAVSADGVNSSTATYTVKLNVSDNEDGTLKVEVAEGSDDPKKLDFENHYAAEGSVRLEVTKALKGRAWKGTDTFSFELKALNGAPMPEGTAAGVTTQTITIKKDTAYGGAAYTEAFGKISFSMEDLKTNGIYASEKTFEYEIREIDSLDEDIEYDKNTYTAKVTVTDGKKGALNTSVKFYLNGAEVSPAGQAGEGKACVTGRGGLQITNTYVSDADEDDDEDEGDGARTGDDSHVILYSAILITAILIMLFLMIRRFRRRDDQ